MPGILTAAPLRTLTNRGLSHPKLLPALFKQDHGLVDLIHQSAGQFFIGLVVGIAYFRRDGETGRNR